MNIETYIERKDRLINTLFRIDTEGNGYFLEDGKKYTRDQFSHKYPTPMKLHVNVRENADKSKKWLSVD